MNLILRLIVNAIAVFAAAYLLSGVHVAGFTTAIIVAVVLGVLNLFIKPILIILTLPITLITLGLFLLIINALIIMLCDSLVPGFDVDGIGWALLFSLLVSLISGGMEGLAKKSD